VLRGLRFTDDATTDLGLRHLGRVVAREDEHSAAVPRWQLQEGSRIQRQAGEGTDVESCESGAKLID
jgi:hypothetical protein